jgi:hypothetical protein
VPTSAPPTTAAPQLVFTAQFDSAADGVVSAFQSKLQGILGGAVVVTEVHPLSASNVLVFTVKPTSVETYLQNATTTSLKQNFGITDLNVATQTPSPTIPPDERKEDITGAVAGAVAGAVVVVLIAIGFVAYRRRAARHVRVDPDYVSMNSAPGV